MPRNNAAAQRERERQQRERQQREAQQRAQREAQQRAQREAQQRAQREAQQRAQREAQQRAQREAQQRAKQEADRRAKQQAQQKAKQEADRRAKQQAQQKAKQDANRKAQQQKQQQQKGKQQGNVKAAIRQAEAGGITRKELQKISKQTGASNQEIVKRMDAMNKAGRDVRLNAGAANTIVRQAQKTPYDPFGRQPSFGTGNIARALQGMIGTPGSPGAMIKGQRIGGREAIPGTGPMAGGMQIRKGGRPAVIRGMAQPAAPAKPAAPMPAMPAPVDGGMGDGGMGDGGLGGFDFASLFDGLFGGMEEPMMPQMPALESFAPVSADVLAPVSADRDPLQLAALGQSYASDMIRAKQRQAQGRRAYMRGGQAVGGVGSPLAALLSIGGLTL